MWTALLGLWLCAAPAMAADPVDDTTRAVRAERSAVAGLALAGAGLATTGVGAWLRWSPDAAPTASYTPSVVMGAGTATMWVGTGLAAFQSLRVARLRGAPLGTGSAAIGFWTASIATQLLFAYGAPAALATVSGSLSIAQLRVGRKGNTRLSLRWIVPRQPLR